MAAATSRAPHLHPTTGELWIVEHGPQGSDELNLPAAGVNHGWPVITCGRNHEIGTKIGDGTERADVAAPEDRKIKRPFFRPWTPLVRHSARLILLVESAATR